MNKNNTSCSNSFSFDSQVQNSFQENLNLLSVSDPVIRRNVLSEILLKSNLDFSIQESAQTDTNSINVKNYLFHSGNQSEPHLLFCAHYDAYPGSCGANDNAAAVCILIEVAKTLIQRNDTAAEFALFDGEECNHTGSKLFVNSLAEDSNISAVINLDICGYGDTLAVHSHGNIHKIPIYNFCSNPILSKHNGCVVKYLPESDNITFKSMHLPTLNIAIMPKYDIPFLKILSTYANNIIGKPPEYELVLGQMEVMSTMHCNFRDKVSTVQTSAMIQVYQYLLDALYSPLQKKSIFGLKL